MSAPLPDRIEGEEQLEEIMTIPPPQLVDFMKSLEGDIAILGIAGKMGITLGRQAVRAIEAAGVKKKVIGVSRFSDPASRKKVESYGMETIACDLLDRDAVAKLPLTPNVLYMAGRKFGTKEDSSLTWAMNTLVPGNVGHHFTKSRIVVFSSGNVYPLVDVKSGGCTEREAPTPLGEYAQSVLGREKVFTYYGRANKTPMLLYRLNYAVDLRYGVLFEIAQQVWNDQPIDLATGHANVVWQGDANAWAIQCLGHCATPPKILNITGPETMSLRYAAEVLGEAMGKTPQFIGTESDTALLNNASEAQRLFGYPSVALERVLHWTAHWVKIGGASLNKATHFEVRDGKF